MMISTVRQLWQRRALIKALTASNLKQSHRNTLLGSMWWVLDPLMMTAVYTIVVGVILNRGQAHDPYPAFLMAGLIAWKSFASTLSFSTNAISASDGLIKSFAFPRAVIPISLVLSNTVLFSFSLLVLLGLCGFYQFIVGKETIHLGWTLLLIPAVTAVQFVITLGWTLLISCFGVFFRDLGNILTHLLRVGWYLSPGLYSTAEGLGLAPGVEYAGLASVDFTRFRSIFVLNPFVHVIEGYRAVILDGQTPDWLGLAAAGAFGLLSVVVGLKVFQSKERRFAKAI